MQDQTHNTASRKYPMEFLRLRSRFVQPKCFILSGPFPMRRLRKRMGGFLIGLTTATPTLIQQRLLTARLRQMLGRRSRSLPCTTTESTSHPPIIYCHAMRFCANGSSASSSGCFTGRAKHAKCGMSLTHTAKRVLAEVDLLHALYGRRTEGRLARSALLVHLDDEGMETIRQMVAKCFR
jgi:hypothetical protein